MSYIRTAAALLASATLLAAAPGIASANHGPQGDLVATAPQAQGWTAEANRIDVLGPKYVRFPAVVASTPSQPTGAVDWTPIGLGIGIAALALAGAGLVAVRRHHRLPKAHRLAPM